MVFNPVEQNRLCVISVLVNTPHVRVLTEEGQPMAVQLSPVWQSLTDVNPDVFQVRKTFGKGVQAACFHYDWSLLLYDSSSFHGLLMSIFAFLWKNLLDI